MLYPDELHLARLVASECTKELAQDTSESVTVHANALRPRLRKFIHSSKILHLLDVLETLGEIKVLGLGWYELSPPIRLEDFQITVGLSDTALSAEFPNAYAPTNSACNSTDSASWLGPPFNLSESPSSIFYEMSDGNEYQPDSCDVYWTDSGSGKVDGKNWLQNVQARPLGSLLRYDRTWFKDFFQYQNGKAMQLTPTEAYELAALKDFAAGLKYPFGFLPGDEADVAIKAKRYYPKSVRKLCLLMSHAIDVRGQTYIYEMSRSNFERLKVMSADYIKFTKGF